jgi:hypothetical protein
MIEAPFRRSAELAFLSERPVRLPSQPVRTAWGRSEQVKYGLAGRSFKTCGEGRRWANGARTLMMKRKLEGILYGSAASAPAAQATGRDQIGYQQAAPALK